jgi:hypothetical protein
MPSYWLKWGLTNILPLKPWSFQVDKIRGGSHITKLEVVYILFSPFL